MAVLGHSLTALQVQPSPAWLLAYLTAADSTHLASTPAGCSYLMHTLGTLMQLGCLHHQQQHIHQQPQPQPVGAAGMRQAVRAAPAISSSAHAPPAGAGGGRDAAAGAGQSQDAMAAAAGQQLLSMAHVLAAQCIRCFLDHGHCFTAEQLGMFCKGLAQWGMRGTPQLAGRLEQVSLGVAHRQWMFTACKYCTAAGRLVMLMCGGSSWLCCRGCTDSSHCFFQHAGCLLAGGSTLCVWY